MRKLNVKAVTNTKSCTAGSCFPRVLVNQKKKKKSARQDKLGINKPSL